MSTNFNVEALALVIENEARDAANLSLLKSELALLAQAELNKQNITGAKAVALAFLMADEAEKAVVAWAQEKTGRANAVLSAQAKCCLLQGMGAGLVTDFSRQYETQRGAARVRKNEARKGIIRQ